MKIARFTEGARTAWASSPPTPTRSSTWARPTPSLPTDVGVLLASGNIASVARTAASAPRLALSASQARGTDCPATDVPRDRLELRRPRAESGMAKPKAPVVFNKQVTCVVGPGDGIEVPTVAGLGRLRG
jgi:hypothetical protein